MNIIEFIEQDLNNKPKDTKMTYNKRVFIIYYSMDFEQEESDQIERVAKFYRAPLIESNIKTNYIVAYKIKTNLYKNYVVLMDSIKNHKTDYKLMSIIKTPIKKNKESIIQYQKQNEIEFIKRDFMKVIELIKEYQNNQVLEIEKFYKKDLKKYESLRLALNELKTREREIFLLKLMESNEYELKENKKFFLKWTLKQDKDTIKRAIVYILNEDNQKGLNFFIYDYDYEEQINKMKWQRKLYYRDLYNRLLNQYLNETNGDQERAKELTKKDIEENHTRPKNLRWLNDYH